MAPLTFQIHLDLEGRTKFRAGSAIRGSIQISNTGTKVKEIKELRVNLLAQEYVNFEITTCSPCCFCIPCVGYYQFRCNKTKEYGDMVNFMDQYIQLLGPSMIPVGEHLFHFKFSLPLGCPSSYVSKLGGHVGYFLSAKMKIPGLLGMDEKEKQSLQVEGSLNFEDYEISQKPTYVEKEKGKRVVIVFLQKQGYLPQEVIDFTAGITNKKGVPQSEEITVSLFKTEQLFSKRNAKLGKLKEVLIAEKRHNLSGGAELVWTDKLRILGNLPPTDLAGSQLLQVQYYVQVKVHGIKVEMPIVLGTPDNNDVQEEDESEDEDEDDAEDEGVNNDAFESEESK